MLNGTPPLYNQYYSDIMDYTTFLSEADFCICLCVYW